MRQTHHVLNCQCVYSIYNLTINLSQTYFYFYFCNLKHICHHYLTTTVSVHKLTNFMAYGTWSSMCSSIIPILSRTNTIPRINNYVFKIHSNTAFPSTLGIFYIYIYISMHQNHLMFTMRYIVAIQCFKKLWIMQCINVFS